MKKIKRFFSNLYGSIEDFFYNLKYGILNFWKWRSVVWNDRDWDFDFLFEVLVFKLGNMAELHQKHGIHMDKDKVIKDMNVVRDAMIRLQKDSYAEKEWEEAHEFSGEMYSEPVDGSEMLYEMKYENINTIEDEEKFRKMVQAISDKQKEGIEKDLDIAFDTMKKNIFDWWD